MAITAKDSLGSDKTGQFRRTWQLNRHLAVDLNAQLHQLSKRNSKKILALNQTIKNLRKEIEIRKYEESNLMPNFEICLPEGLSRPTSASTSKGSTSVNLSSAMTGSSSTVSFAWK